MKKFIFALGLLTAAITMTAYAGDTAVPYASASEPHATLQMNVDKRASQIYPVRLWEVNGKLSNRIDQGTVWMKPGQYTLKVKIAHATFNRDVPGLIRNAGSAVTGNRNEINLKLEDGMVYYLGAKFSAGGKWQVVVWKTEKVDG